MRTFVLIGTRPEAIKLAPVVRKLRVTDSEVLVGLSGQHGDLVAVILGDVGLSGLVNIGDFKRGRAMPQMLSDLVMVVSRAISRFAPDWIVVQGDTLTAYAGAVVGYLDGCRVAHVEAGLRTADLLSPFPEEGLRQMVSRIATCHFAPTVLAFKNLTREGVEANRIHVVGNTVVDALDAIRKDVSWPFGFQKPSGFTVLVTCHRRENLDEAIFSLCRFVREEVGRGDTTFLLLKHANPIVRNAFDSVSDSERVIALPPLSYCDMMGVLKHVDAVITDSGGIVEECTTIGTRVLIYRSKTERQEAVDVGSARIAFSHAELMRGLRDCRAGTWRCEPSRVFGDGLASHRIVEIMERLTNDGN